MRYELLLKRRNHLSSLLVCQKGLDILQYEYFKTVLAEF